MDIYFLLLFTHWFPLFQTADTGSVGMRDEKRAEYSFCLHSFTDAWVSWLQVQEAKSDNWTQLVLLVYVFLCGVCVGRVEGLWMAPISAASFVFAAKALPMLAPSTWTYAQVLFCPATFC